MNETLEYSSTLVALRAHATDEVVLKIVKHHDCKIKFTVLTIENKTSTHITQNDESLHNAWTAADMMQNGDPVFCKENIDICLRPKKEPVSMCCTSKGLTGCYVPIDDEERRQFRTSATLALFAFEYWIGF